MVMSKSSVKTAGQSGGFATLKKYGPEHYSKIAKAKWRAYRKNKKNTKTSH